MLNAARMRIALAVMGLLSVHCVEPYFPEEEPVPPPAADAKPKAPSETEEDAAPPLDPANTTPVDTTTEPEQRTEMQCTHECTTEGARRCSTASNSATEVCKLATDGCRKWTSGPSCAADYTCDKIRNDGTCKAGCTNDAGCSAANAGSARCTSDGRTELTCTKVGACYVWKTTRTNVPQQCITPVYCGPTTGRRIKCVASPAGACTQHVATFNDCPSGTTCTGAGQCTATCTNACTKYATRCVTGSARSTQVCVTGSNGCTVWAAGPSCSPEETCSSGVCN